MKGILETWLNDSMRLNVVMSEIGDASNDGILFAKILNKYNVISKPLLLDITSSTKYKDMSSSSKVRFRNLMKLHIWFKLLKIIFNKDVALDVSESKPVTCLRILHELYLCLETKNYYDIMYERYTEIIRDNPAFKINESYMHTALRPKLCKYPTSFEFLDEDTFSSRSGRHTSHRSSRWKEKLPTIRTIIRPKILLERKVLNKVIKRKDGSFEYRYSHKYCSSPKGGVGSNTLGTLKSTTASSPGLNMLKPKAVHNYVESLKLESEKKLLRSNLIKCFQEDIMNKVWQTVLHKEMQNFNTSLRHKLVQQSRFERLLASNLIKVHTERQFKLSENRSRIQSDTSFINYFDERGSDSDLYLYITDTELHKKLWAEKIKKRHARHYLFCLNIVQDIVDLGIIKSEYEASNKGLIPKEIFKNYKNQFIKGQPLYQPEPLQMISVREESSVVIIGQKEKDEHKNEFLLEEYLFLLGDWFVEELWPDFTLPTNCDNPILSYIVYKLFEAKFPIKKLKPVDLPNYPIMCILNNVYETIIVAKLEILLRKPNIFVFYVTTATEFCIKCYEKETGPETPDEKLKSPKKISPKKDKRGNVVVPQFRDEEVQTSIVDLVPEQKPLSNAAKVGGEILDCMKLGKDLSKEIILNSIIELLKSQSRIHGWVLVNFPTTLTEASFLERNLLGKQFPIKTRDDYSQDESNEFDPEAIEDFLKDKETDKPNSNTVTHSRLVPMPDFFQPYHGKFKSYFSKFIMVIKKEIHHDQQTTDDVLSTYSQDISRDDQDHLCAFYKKVGIYQELIYESIDSQTLVKLAKLIVCDNDDDSGNARAEDLFGTDALQMIAQRNELMKKRSRKSIISRSSTHSDKLSMEEKSLDLSQAKSEEEKTLLGERNAKPGEEGWCYVDYPLTTELCLALSEFWDNAENSYLENLKNIFLANINNQDTILPYINRINKLMGPLSNDFAERDAALKDFVKEFNKESHSNKKYMSDKLGYKVYEMCVKIWNFIDQKRNKTEGMRTKLLNDNWISDHFFTLTNLFISMIIVELKRYMDTIQFLRCYYKAMLANLQSDVNESNFPSQQTFPHDEICLIAGPAEYNSLKSQMLDYMNNNANCAEEFENPFYSALKIRVAAGLKYVDRLKAFSFEMIRKGQIYVLTGTEIPIKQEDKMSISGMNSFKSPIRSQGSSVIVVEHLMEKEKELSDLCAEWKFAVKCEISRVLFRIELIKRKAEDNINFLQNILKVRFDEITTVSQNEYVEECNCLSIFVTHVEKRIALNRCLSGEINFMQHRFYFQTDQSCSHYHAEPAYEYARYQETFQLTQLESLGKIFKGLAPDGFISQKTLCYILEDMALPRNEQLLPTVWSTLSNIQVRTVIEKVFGRSGIANWKDFLLYGFEIPFPTREEIVADKLQFLSLDKDRTGLVSYDDYMSMNMWFQRNCTSDSNNIYFNPMKRILFSLYSVDETALDYISLLLEFCKDHEPKFGFGKALSLMTGKCIIVSKRESNYEKIIENYKKSIYKIISQILNQIIYDVVNMCDLPIIYEYNGEKQIEEIDIIDKRKLAFPYEWLFEYEDQDSKYSMLAEHKFIEKQRILNWTSKVPSQVLVDLLVSAIAPIHKLKRSCPIEKFDENLRILLREECLHVPSTMANAFVIDCIGYSSKFKISSLSLIIHEIKKNAEPKFC